MPIGVCVSLKNPLNVQINLRNIVLLWTAIPGTSGICEDSTHSNAAASSEPEPELSIPPDSTRYVRKKKNIYIYCSSYIDKFYFIFSLFFVDNVNDHT